MNRQRRSVNPKNELPDFIVPIVDEEATRPQTNEYVEPPVYDDKGRRVYKPNYLDFGGRYEYTNTELQYRFDTLGKYYFPSIYGTRLNEGRPQRLVFDTEAGERGYEDAYRRYNYYKRITQLADNNPKHYEPFNEADRYNHNDPVLLPQYQNIQMGAPQATQSNVPVGRKIFDEKGNEVIPPTLADYGGVQRDAPWYSTSKVKPPPSFINHDDELKYYQAVHRYNYYDMINRNAVDRNPKHYEPYNPQTQSEIPRIYPSYERRSRKRPDLPSDVVVDENATFVPIPTEDNLKNPYDLVNRRYKYYKKIHDSTIDNDPKHYVPFSRDGPDEPLLYGQYVNRPHMPDDVQEEADASDIQSNAGSGPYPINDNGEFSGPSSNPVAKPNTTNGSNDPNGLNREDENYLTDPRIGANPGAPNGDNKPVANIDMPVSQPDTDHPFIHGPLVNPTPVIPDGKASNYQNPSTTPVDDFTYVNQNAPINGPNYINENLTLSNAGRLYLQNAEAEDVSYQLNYSDFNNLINIQNAKKDVYSFIYTVQDNNNQGSHE